MRASDLSYKRGNIIELPNFTPTDDEREYPPVASPCRVRANRRPKLRRDTLVGPLSLGLNELANAQRAEDKKKELEEPPTLIESDETRIKRRKLVREIREETRGRERFQAAPLDLVFPNCDVLRPLWLRRSGGRPEQ